MKKQYFLTTVFIYAIIPFSVQSMTEEEYEKKIHNIYLKHYKQPVSSSDWNSQIQSLPNNYKLKFKDNLWDLSGSFFSNSLYWSKLWVANPQVENPHLIYKNDSLKLDVQDLVNVNSSEHSVDIQSQFPGLVIPQQKFTRDSLKESEIPSSLPFLLSFHQFDFEINTSQLKPIDVDKETIVPFYLTEKSLSKDGEVIGRDGYGEVIAFPADRIIVRINSSVSIGDVFTVFKNTGRISNFFKSLVGLSEKEIMVKGKIKILSYLNNEDSLYMALVEQSLDSIFPGDSLLRGEPQVYNFSQQGRRGAGAGKIIGTPDKSQLLLNLGSIVYLNKGQSSGIQPGDIFYIKTGRREAEGFQRPYGYSSVNIGELRIIHSLSDRATAVIISSRDQIYVGDIFSGELNQLKDLSESIEHEEFDLIEDQEQDVLIDFEEIEEESGDFQDGEEEFIEESGDFQDGEEEFIEESGDFQDGEGEFIEESENEDLDSELKDDLKDTNREWELIDDSEVDWEYVEDSEDKNLDEASIKDSEDKDPVNELKELEE